jgi:hypothetical protein
VKIDLSTFSEVSTLTLATGENRIWALAVSGGYLYAGLYTYPGKVVKIDLSTFTKVSTLTLATGENYVYSLAVSGGYLYAGVYTSPGKVVKIDLSTFTKVSTLTFASGEDYVCSLAVSGSYLYAGLYTSPGKVVKIDLSTFSEVSALTFATGEELVYSLAVSGSYLYAGLALVPGEVVKIDLSTFSEVSALTFATGESVVWVLAVSGGYLYAGLDTSPGKVVGIDLSTFTKVSTLTLATGENYVYSLAVSGGYLYAGLVTSPGKVVKTGYPAASGWRTESALNGTFAAGTWTFKVRLESDTKYGFSVKVAARLSKGSSADGAGRAILGVYESPNTIAIPASAGGSVTDSWTASLSSISMSNEYLFAEYRIHIEVAGTSTSAQCSFACDENPTTADESIQTTTFTPAAVKKYYPIFRLKPRGGDKRSRALFNKRLDLKIVTSYLPLGPTTQDLPIEPEIPFGHNLPAEPLRIPPAILRPYPEGLHGLNQSLNDITPLPVDGPPRRKLLKKRLADDPALLHNLLHGSVVHRHHRCPAAHRLHRDEAERLRHHRGEDQGLAVLE